MGPAEAWPRKTEVQGQDTEGQGAEVKIPDGLTKGGRAHHEWKESGVTPGFESLCLPSS